MEPKKPVDFKNFTECPGCKKIKEGTSVFQCKQCRKFFCEFCDFGSGTTIRCPCSSGNILKVGIIAELKKAEEKQSSDPPWVEKHKVY